MPRGRPPGAKDSGQRKPKSRPPPPPYVPTPTGNSPPVTFDAIDAAKPRSRARKPGQHLPPQAAASLKDKFTRDRLPHLFGWKWYAWALAFFRSTQKISLLCAGNQLSKSSSQIRKAIHWATEQKIWPTLWATKPQIFWYLYPSEDVATVEFKKKWVPEFLPRAEMQTDPVYGWEVEYRMRYVHAIHFKSGVSIYFKTYGQRATVLQSATLHAVFADEELPEHFYDELKARLYATGGYFSMVFTATLGQELWRRAMEGKGEQEVFPDAFKIQVSMYDCLVYADGTPGPWTVERIKEIESECKSEDEIAKRVHGKFVLESGRKYHTYHPDRHLITPRKIPDNWMRVSGVDCGAGGKKNHPAAIVFVAVNPERTHAYAYLGWRGDGVQTAAGDVLDKYVEMKGETVVQRQFVDPRAMDFKVIAGRLADKVGAFENAECRHEIGEEVLNTLFAHNMIEIFDTEDGEMQKLSGELMSLLRSTGKARANDNLCDGLRYACTKIAWDWSVIKDEFRPDGVDTTEPKQMTAEDEVAQQIRQRRGEMETATDDWQDFYDDILEANEAYGT